MDGLLRDIRFTLRNILRTPGLAVVVAVSLALGIGANTAIFGLMRALLLRSLPVPNPQELVLFYWGADTWPTGLINSSAGGGRETSWPTTSRSMPYPFFREVRADSRGFSTVFAFVPLGSERSNTTLSAGGLSELVDGEMVSGGFFPALGVQAAVGRTISDEDERASALVAVLSHAYWTRRFGGDPGIIGRAVRINGVPFDVIGVAPPTFTGVQRGRMPDIWVPLVDSPALTAWGYRPDGPLSPFDRTDYGWLHVMARLEPGVTLAQAQASLDGRFQSFIRAALPRVDPAHTPHLELEAAAGGLDTISSRYETPLRVLMAMVALVLLIACANIAVLLLARSMGRRREFAMRLSIGAARGRLIRQMLTETLVMAVAGGVLGVLCGSWTSRGLLLLVPSSERPLIDAPIDPTVLLFAAAVSALTALAAGLAPALLATRVDILPSLKETTSGAVHSEHPATRIWSSAFVVGQVALSLVLLFAAVLFARTLTNLYHQPLGVDERRLLVFGLDASQSGYSGDRLINVYSDVLRRLDALPGVESATAMRLRLFSGWVNSGSITLSGMKPPEGGTYTQSNHTGADVARTLGLQVLAGRDLAWSDVDGRKRVAIVNEAMASYFFPDGQAIGRRFNFGSRPDPAAEYEIVGVVSNARYSQVRGTYPRTAYVPFTAMDIALHGLYFCVRTPGDPAALTAAVRTAVSDVDPGLSPADMASMSSQVGDSLWRERLFARLTGVFGLLALTLTCVGLYGTISYGVGRRRSEIAVRMALGAQYRQVLWMVLRRAVVLAAIGVAAGIPLTLWSGRYAGSLLFGLTTRDPATIALAAAALFATASFAGYIPARRAALVDPALALKQE